MARMRIGSCLMPRHSMPKGERHDEFQHDEDEDQQREAEADRRSGPRDRIRTCRRAGSTDQSGQAVAAARIGGGLVGGLVEELDDGDGQHELRRARGRAA